MRNRGCLAVSLIAFLAIGIFAAADCLLAAESNQQAHESLMQGAKKIRDGHKQILELSAQKGIKDPELRKATKEMDKGYSELTKGAGMMNGKTTAKGKAMVTRGANMMIDADRATREAIGRHGNVEDYSTGFSMSDNGQRMLQGAFQTYGLQGNWRGVH